METPPTRNSRRRRPSGALAGGLSGTLKAPKPAYYDTLIRGAEEAYSEYLKASEKLDRLEGIVERI